MPHSIHRPPMSSPVHSLDHVRATPAKADLSGPSRSIAVGGVVKDALARHYGSLKAAAISMGNYDPSQLTRDLDRGTFNLQKLDRCDDEAKAFVTQALHEAFGDLDPSARRRRIVRDLRRNLDELAEVI